MNRDELIRETFEMSREIGYRHFLAKNVDRDDPALTRLSPDERKAFLRNWWDAARDRMYESYLELVSGYGVTELRGMREGYIEALSATDIPQWQRDKAMNSKSEFREILSGTRSNTEPLAERAETHDKGEGNAMTDKAKSSAETEGMSREQLVRAHFDAYGDLVWAQNQPKFREDGLDPESMRRYREAWKAHSEKRDWEWWQDRVKDSSNEELKTEIAECMEEIKALGMRQPGRDEATTGGQASHDIVNRAGDGERGTPEPALTKGRKM